MKHYCHGNNPTWLIANQRLLLSRVCQFAYVSDHMRFSARSTCWVLLCSYNSLSIVYASVEVSCCLLYFFFFFFYLYSTFIVFCCTPNALYNHVCVWGGGSSPQPPPMCSIHFEWCDACHGIMALQKPSTFPSSTCIDLLLDDLTYFIYIEGLFHVICAAAVFLTCSQQLMCECIGSSKSCSIADLFHQDQTHKHVMYITMLNSSRVVMTEIYLEI